jgi:hypothetical protein
MPGVLLLGAVEAKFRTFLVRIYAIDCRGVDTQLRSNISLTICRPLTKFAIANLRIWYGLVDARMRTFHPGLFSHSSTITYVSLNARYSIRASILPEMAQLLSKSNFR